MATGVGGRQSATPEEEKSILHKLTKADTRKIKHANVNLTNRLKHVKSVSGNYISEVHGNASDLICISLAC